MFKVDRAGSNSLQISVGGKLDAAEASQMIDTLLAQAQGIENGTMLIDVEDFHLPTFGAFKVELSRLPELFRFTRGFRRAAVVSDETWVNAMSTIEGKLLPGIAIKSFRRDQRSHAQTWLQDVDRKSA